MSNVCVSFTGACRGETRAYVKLEASNPLPNNLVAAVETAEGQHLPAEVLVDKTSSTQSCIISLPLFNCSKVTISLLSSGYSDEKPTALWRKTISSSRLAFMSRLSSVARSSLCAELRGSENRIFSNCTSKLSFIQAFQGEDGKTVYRCHIGSHTLYSLDSFTLRDGTGKAMNAPLLFVEHWHRQSNDSRFPYAATLSLETDDKQAYFALSVPDGTFAAMNPNFRGALIGRQDELMINPGIDKRYSNAVVLQPRRDQLYDLPDSGTPSFSIIVPLYETPVEYLKNMLDSVLAQTYPGWELVLVNASPRNEEMRAVLSMYADSRIIMLDLPENLGIAGNTNAGIAIATGDFLCFLDHDDVLEPTALEHYAKAIAEDPEIDLLYCDEDNCTGVPGPCTYPRLKPDYNLSLLYSHFYFLHMLTVKRSVIEQSGMADADSSGAQDYDLALHALERTKHIAHIPEILYHWRVHPGSTNGGMMESKPYAEAAAIRSIERHLKRRGINATVDDVDIPGVYNVNYRRIGKSTPVSLVLLAHSLREVDRFTEACLDSSTNNGPLAEIIVVCPEHSDDLTLKNGSGLPRITCASVDATASFADRANAGVSASNNETVLVCNPALKGDLPDAAAQLAGCLARTEVGIVAPKLYYADGLVQHAGLCVKPDGTFGYLNQNFAARMGGGYHGTAECSCDYTAVSPACFMLRKSQWTKLDGFENFADCPEISLVDHCFKLREKGLSATVLPDAPLVNTDAMVLWPDRPTAFSLPDSEALKQLWGKWPEQYKTDVLANPHVDLQSSYFRLLND